MDLQLANRLALISGSTAGIGFAIAHALAAEGARVIVNGRSSDSVDAAVARLAPITGSQVSGFAGDLSDASTAAELARRHPGVEILVNLLGCRKVFDERRRSWPVHPELQRFVAKRMAAAATEVDSSHVPMLSKPKLVLDVIRKAADAVQKSAAAQSV